MAFDFNPDLSEEPEKPKRQSVTKQELPNTVVQSEAALVSNNLAVNSNTSEVVTINNLLNLTQTHISDDLQCRQVIEDLTDELNNSIHLMSIKEILEYLKVKLREREFHTDCIFKAYAFIQKSEQARELFLGSNRKERIIEATDRKRITNLLSMLNDTGD